MNDVIIGVIGAFIGIFATLSGTWLWARIRGQRIQSALKADMKRARRIAAHNKRTALFPTGSPRAFIKVPVDSYDTLLFGGEVDTLTRRPDLLLAVMAYLEHVYHVNAMIDRYQNEDDSDRYLGPIVDACESDGSLRAAIDELAQLLDHR